MFAALEASGDVYDTVPYKAVETVSFAIPSEPNEEIYYGTRAIERELLVIGDRDAASVKFGLSAEGLLTEPHK